MIITLILTIWAVVSTALAVWYRYESEHYQQTADYWYGRTELIERRAERLRTQRDRALALLKEVRNADDRA
jgi:hypothetical protein